MLTVISWPAVAGLLRGLFGPLSRPWKSAVFRLPARASAAADDLGMRLNDANLHVIEVRDGPDTLVAVRYNPVAYSATLIAAKLSACGFVAEYAHAHPAVAARTLWLAQGS